MRHVFSLLLALPFVSAFAAPSTPVATPNPVLAPLPVMRPISPMPTPKPDAPITDAEALAIEALEGLIAAPPERALPLVKRVLNGQQTPRVKQRALFVLGMIDLPEAKGLLVETARTGKGELQSEAIRALGIRGGRDLAASLGEIYRNGDANARRAVIEAYMISDNKEGLLAIANSAKSTSDSREAIHALGAMGAVAELGELRRSGQITADLIQAFAIANDLESLLRMAQSETDEELRAEAVQSIGIIGGDKAHEALRKLYAEAASPRIREAALTGLLIGGDEQGVLQLYRSAGDPTRKRELLRTLSMMGGDAALEAIDAALDGKAP